MMHLRCRILGWFALAAPLVIGARGTAAQDTSALIMATAPRHEAAPHFLLELGTRRIPIDAGRAPALARRISVDLDGVPLHDALDQIARKARIQLMYADDVVPASGTVHLRAQEITVAAALTDLLLNAGVDVVVTGNGELSLARRHGAEAAAIVGRVTDRRTGEGIAGVFVALEGTGLGALSIDSGAYRIAGAPAGAHTVFARRIGYASLRHDVNVPADGEVTLDFALEAAAASLDQVVVTGTPGGEEKRALGNSVATLDVTRAQQVSGAADVSSVLNGRVPGLAVLQGSGKVGAGPLVTIRGRASLSLTSQPIVYIDGVRVDNDAATGPVSQGSQVVSRLNDINPDDIASIEVIKGPAAATLYGTEASNGVIQIITKQGQAGKARWDASVRQGTNWFMNPEGRIGLDYARDPTTGKTLTFDPVAAAKSLGTPLFQNGRLQDYQLSVSGGTDVLQYYVAGNLNDDKGIDPLNRYKRHGGHANLRFSPNHSIDVTASTNVLTSDANLGLDFGDSPMFSALFGNPLLIDTPKHGFFVAPPSVYYSGVFENTQAVDRYTTSLQVNHHPADWFRQHIALGIDQTGEDNIALTNYMDPLAAQLYPAAALGNVNDTRRDVTFQTVDYSATADAPVTSEIIASSSLGGQYYRNETRTIIAAGRDFPGPGVSTVAATAVPTATSTDIVKNTTVGAYGQEQLAWRNRLFLTGAVRVDNNSAFGKDFKWVTYPKVSASWVVSEEPFFRLPFVSALKLRAAYGASGQQPGVFTALRTYEVTAGPNDVPAITPLQVGNPNLKPERGQELEAGLEGSLFGERLGFDFTYYNKSIHDAILLKDNEPSLGFPGQQFVNIGRVDSHGMEMQLTGRPLDHRDVALDLSFSTAIADNMVKNLGGLPFVSVFDLLGQRDVVGYPIGSYFLKKVVSAQLDPSGIATNVLCDGGPGKAPLPCDQAPLVYLGQPTPRVTGAGTATIHLFNRLHLYAMVDFNSGYVSYDWDRNIRCVQIPNCQVLVAPQKFDPRYVAEVQSSSPFVVASNYVSNASFAKLREVSIAYDLPEQWLRPAGARRGTLTVAARNLHTWTSFTGLDPESRSFLPGLSEAISLNQAEIPPLAELTFSLRLSF